MSDVHQSPIPGTGGLLMKYYWTSDKNTDGNYYTMEPAKGSPTVSSSPSTDKNSLYIVRDL